MAIRSEELMAAPGAVVYRFPTRRVRSAAARQRMHARRRRTALAAIAVGMTAVFLLATGPGGSAPASKPTAPAAVTVRHGDTLWGLAEAYAPEGVDLRAYVDLLTEVNDLDGGLRAGMRVRLPK